MSQKHSILIVDDEPANLQKLKRTFIDEYTVIEAGSGEEALEKLRHSPVTAIVTDQKMPGMVGVELLKRSLSLSPDSVRVILTGYTEVEDLMDAINEGHVHRYITKPWDPFSLKEMIRKELENWGLRRENQRLADELAEANRQLARENRQLRQEVEVLKRDPGKLVYRSRSMEELIRLIDRVVETDSTVLVQGETGTGKELLARYIHRQSSRNRASFVPVNCGAVPADLVESAFFGHRKGAFTGAREDRKGFFEMADGGTLFLDEIGETPLEMQVKFLRALQQQEILPVGAEKPIRVNVRVVASTNQNLRSMVENGTFRQDLFFRLNVFSVFVPPLRTRPEDVRLLVEFFLEKCRGRINKPVSGITENAMQLLESFSWPGNVRELENEIERLVILCDAGGWIDSDLLAERIRRRDDAEIGRTGSLKEAVARLERKLILDALENCQNNKTQAAKTLGITRQTVIAKLKQYEPDSLNS